MIVAIFVFAPIGLPAWYLLVLTRILGVPLIAGISFEIIKFAGRNRRKRWVRAIMWPGLQLQKLTTREPDLDQLAVAIAAMDAVLANETPASTTPRTSSASKSWRSLRPRCAGGLPSGRAAAPRASPRRSARAPWRR